LSKLVPGTFDIDDLERVLTDIDKLIMMETILAWAELDTGISRLTLLVFGMDFDAGSILIGNMDLKTKVERIKALCEHRGHAAAKEWAAKLIPAMQEHSISRNAVAHRKCVGRLISQPTRLVFMSAKHVKGYAGRFEMMAIDHSELTASAKFARKAAKEVGAMIDGIEAGGNNGNTSA
jgi:hypothetical protein